MLGRSVPHIGASEMRLVMEPRKRAKSAGSAGRLESVARSIHTSEDRPIQESSSDLANTL